MMTRVFRSAPLPPLPGLDPDAARPVVMGIVNVTADSFSGDGLLKNGEPGDATRAIAQARAQVAAGAAMIDLGAGSTPPGAATAPDTGRAASGATSCPFAETP